MTNTHLEPPAITRDPGPVSTKSEILITSTKSETSEDFVTSDAINPRNETSKREGENDYIYCTLYIMARLCLGLI